MGETRPYESCYLSDAGLSAIGDGFPKLEKLSLISCSNAICTGLMSLAHKCNRLKTLDLKSCYVGDQGLVAVSKCCKELEVLNLRFCEGLSDAGLVALAVGCGKSFKFFGVAACAKISDTALEAVGSHCKSLETLCLLDSESFHNNGVLSVTLGCPLLKNLKLECINVTDEALIAVGIRCVSLELLALIFCQRFTNKSITLNSSYSVLFLIRS